MNLEFITDHERWQQIYTSLPDFPGKIYYSSGYCRCFQANGEGQAAAVFLQNGEQRIFYPFLIKKIPSYLGGDGFIDLETAYGYGGPAIFATEKAFTDEFLNQFATWARNNNVVAEFVRFNPLTANHEWLQTFYQVSLNRLTVSINLQQDFKAMLSCCTQPRQRNYRRACKAGLILEKETGLKAFSGLYAKTMQRLGAESYYLFSPEFFAAVDKIDSDQRFYAKVITPNGKTAAAGIFLFDTTTAHYHLGASDPEFKLMQPNVFMMLEMARIAQKNKLQQLHLGGGLSMKDSDSLMRFKASFSDRRHQFFIGKKIHDQQKYANLSQAWQLKTGKTPDILLHYHYGENHANL